MKINMLNTTAENRVWGVINRSKEVERLDDDEKKVLYFFVDEFCLREAFSFSKESIRNIVGHDLVNEKINQTIYKISELINR